MERTRERTRDSENVRLTFSEGACRWKPEDGIRGLISRADEALYHAKAEGGNTIVHLDEYGSPRAGETGDGD